MHKKQHFGEPCKEVEIVAIKCLASERCRGCEEEDTQLRRADSRAEHTGHFDYAGAGAWIKDFEYQTFWENKIDHKEQPKKNHVDKGSADLPNNGSDPQSGTIRNIQQQPSPPASTWPAQLPPNTSLWTFLQNGDSPPQSLASGLQLPSTEALDFTTQNWKTGYRLVKKNDIVHGLPITFEGDPGPATVMAVPDSGSSYNVMSLKLALLLGHRLEWKKSETIEVRFLDDVPTVCTAIVQANCRFAKTFAFDWKMRCTFLVLPSLVEDLIMSASFLEKTATFTKFRNPLVQISLRTPQLLRVCAMGAIHGRLTCCIDGESVLALPDSGSDIDIISLAYATKRGLKWHDTLEEVMFADGRIKTPRGKFEAQLALGSMACLIEFEEYDDFDEFSSKQTTSEELMHNGPVIPSHDVVNIESRNTPVLNIICTTFYILDGITVDVLIGAKSLESLQVYTLHTNYLDSFAGDTAANNLHRITLASKIRKCVDNLIPSPGQRPSQASSLEEQLNEADQQENARREEVSSRISQMTGEARANLEREEEDKRREYENYRNHLIRSWRS
ncbi:hypothetical protein yc1106_02849 [Curvularia clavata]|uniref:Uncharacterized protein n=1 Tax=Curvularia clavata TaxID=95742 RepID=A0A9Q8Z5K7_CURCL|nr:hypothetical protein yc1106_02849 [Curvularia clavata]